MAREALDTYQTTVNVIVTFEEEEQLVGYVDVRVKFNLYPLNRELDCVEQVVSTLLERNSQFRNVFKRDYSRLVKLSLAYQVPHDEFYTADDNTGPRWQFTKRVNSKYYFQPNQRDLIEDLLVQNFEVAFNTAEFDFATGGK